MFSTMDVKRGAVCPECFRTTDRDTQTHRHHQHEGEEIMIETSFLSNLTKIHPKKLGLQ